MKFYNKKKATRMNWTMITMPDSYDAANAKIWCQRHLSAGRFYFKHVRVNSKYTYFWTSTWWFESAEDALVFKLRWHSFIQNVNPG